MDDLKTLLQKRKSQLGELAKISMDDISICNKYLDLKQENSQFWRRVVYRVFASIEALISHLKQSVLLFTIDRKDMFSPSERLALDEKEYWIGDVGLVTTKKAKIRFLPNLIFAFKAFATAIENPFTINKDSSWESLTKSIKVRDRITHPKTAEDYSITENDMKDLFKAWDWFGASLVAVSKQRSN